MQGILLSKLCFRARAKIVKRLGEICDPVRLRIPLHLKPLAKVLEGFVGRWLLLGLIA